MARRNGAGQWAAALRLAAALGCAGVLAGCTLEPPAARAIEFQRTYDASADEVWAALVDSVSASFFGIDGFERDSGLMTISWSGTPSDLVDCGGANHLLPASSLQGRYNLLVRAQGEGASVRVTGRYVLTLQQGTYRSTLAFGNDAPVSGQDPTGFARVTCRATGAAEARILDGIAASL